MQKILMENPDPGLRAYFVWGPFLRSDSVEAAREATQRYWAPNSVYFWSPGAKLAFDMGAVLQLPAGRYAWDVYLVYKRGIQWDKSVPAPAYWQHQLDVLQGAKYDPAALRVRLRELLKDSQRLR